MSQLTELFASADVKVNGSRPWDIKVHNHKFFERVLADGSLGLGESYMDEWWSCDALDQFFFKILSAQLDKKVKPLKVALHFFKAKILNLQTKRGAQVVAKKHYDLSTELYESFLDPYNQYTCGYFKDTTDLNKAQEQKLDLICKKLQLSKDDKVLDIGCGWGGFAKFASSKYGCHVTGISISDEQVKYATEFCKDLPVEIKKCDYRDIEGEFDKVLSCGMIEHVGSKNYKTIMKVVNKVLKEDGLFLLHTIGRSTSTSGSDPWMCKYIFPNSMLPSIKQISAAAEELFILEDLHNFGQYYDPTLMAWFANFEKNWDKIKDKFDERFFRMWQYYLLSCAGAFRARNIQLWQFVFFKNGIPNGYKTPR